MEENKYYLDREGLIQLLDKLSKSIKNHTSEAIEVEEIIDPETGETSKEAKNPGNFTSVKSVVDYLKNRSNIRIHQDSASPTQDGYEVITNEIVYNGEGEVQINLTLASAEDINSLF